MSSSNSNDMILDPKIRDWVLVPILIIMILVGIGRSYAQFLLQSVAPPDQEQMKQKAVLQRSHRLRGNGHLIPEQSFQMRTQYFAKKKDGLFAKLSKSATPPNPMNNPGAMSGMLTNNMTQMLPNFMMMGLVSYFFSGFVLVRVPFPLTPGFRSMLQRGVELSTLDVSFVSSLSWYFLVMFGLRSFYALILGDNNVPDDTRMIQAQMGMAGGGNQLFDAPKLFQQERESLQLAKHHWYLENAEYTYLNKPIPSGKTTSVLDDDGLGEPVN